MKKCFRCSELKDIGDFYTHPKMADGHLNKCKTCSKKDTADRIKIKSFDLDWVLKEKLRCRTKSNLCRKSNPDCKPLPKEEKKKIQDRYFSKYPDRRKAHRAVSNAIRDGRMTKQKCEICGEMKAEAHHDDYSKSLDVRWLCVTHHNEYHIKQRDICIYEKLNNTSKKNINL
jgi:hypothetical protein